MSNNEEPDEGKLHVRFREGGKAAMYGIRIVRHGRGNPETGLRRSLNRAAYPSTRHYNIHYTPGQKASFNEDAIFTTTIPIPDLGDAQIRDTLHDTLHDPENITKLLKALKGEMSREELLYKKSRHICSESHR